MEILATIGKSTKSSDIEKCIKNLIAQDIDCFRFNLSKYSNYQEINQLADEICAIKEKYALNIMLDIPFPYRKPRIFLKEGNMIPLSKNDTIFIFVGLNESIYTDSSEILQLCIGDRIYYDNGIIWRVTGVFENNISIISEVDCLVFNGKSINFNKLILNTPVYPFISIINKIQPHSVALSFVMCADEITEVKQNINSDIEVVCKIETEASVNNIKEIASSNSCAGLMIARGDLMIYADYRYLYSYQNRIFAEAKKYGKKTYFATGILSSLCSGAIPTQAEIIDLSKIVECSPTGIVLNAGIVRNNIELARNIIYTTIQQVRP